MLLGVYASTSQLRTSIFVRKNSSFALIPSKVCSSESNPEANERRSFKESAQTTNDVEHLENEVYTRSSTDACVSEWASNYRELLELMEMGASTGVTYEQLLMLSFIYGIYNMYKTKRRVK